MFLLVFLLSFFGQPLHLFKIHRGAVISLQLIVAALGLGHEGDGLVEQFCSGPLVEAEAGAESSQILPVKEAGAAHSLNAGDMDGVPVVIR